MGRHFSVWGCALVGLAMTLPAATAAGQEERAEGSAAEASGEVQADEQAQSRYDPFGEFPGEQKADPAAASEADAAKVDRSVLVGVPADRFEGIETELCRCIGDTNKEAIARIESALDKPLESNGLDVTDTPLEEVVALLQEEHGIPIQIDTPALEAIGLDAAEQVSASLHNISLRSALKLLLRQVQLTTTIRDEVLLVTTVEEAESELRTCVYDVRGLVVKPPMPMGASAWADYDPLVGTLTSCIAHDTWKENGSGEGDLRSLQPGLLVVTQTNAVHAQIRDLLETIRDMKGAPATAAVEAAPIQQAATKPAPNANDTVTRAYLLQIQHEEKDREKLRNQIRDLIVQSLPDQQWDGRLDNGQAVMLSVLPDRVVVRHKPAVQEEVQAVLVDSGVAAPANTDQSQSQLRGGAVNGTFVTPSTNLGMPTGHGGPPR